jgi:primosomal protein N' (replication factor Y)
VVLALDPAGAPSELRPLHRLVDAPPIAPDLVALASFMVDYYLAPPGEVMRLCLPAGGRARATRRAELTEAGRRAAADLDAALEPLHLTELAPPQRTLLRALASGARPLADLEALAPRANALIAQLAAHGLVAVREEVRTARVRADVFLRAVATDDPPELARAPRRAALLARIRAAGEISLLALRGEDPRAGAHVRALVDAGLVSAERRERPADPFARQGPATPDVPPTLTTSQANAIAAVERALGAGEYAPFLLHGVTGSGKTEVYLRAIAAARAAGRSALVLVPEISLTPQLAERFRARFGDALAVLHSGLGAAERAAAWRRIERGEVAIALGARSAVFAPLARLGIVVVDEEHDASFKQEEGVRYHGRDVALVRARAARAVALLGSATPSLETLAAAREGRYGLLELPERATARPLPPIEIVDLRQHRLAEGSFLSAPLERAIGETLAAGEQTILFLNRRGFATFVLCKSCGVPARCRDCSVTLTYHRAAERLVCHYCGFHAQMARLCPGCGSLKLARLGTGTEKVEALIQERFPSARVARLDRDTAGGRGLERVLDGMRRREVDIVVGTQMITKGHDFPGVTLVGVVSADQGMGLPDFRAAERTYQLLEQVAGRAGRGALPGRVIVQTYNPAHPAVIAARDHDYRRFAEGELRARAELGFPPIQRLACVRLDGADPQRVRAAAEAAAAAAREACARAPAEAHAALLGPSEAPLSRLKGRTRWQLFVKAAQPRALRVVCRAALAATRPPAVRATVDIDPVSVL